MERDDVFETGRGDPVIGILLRETQHDDGRFRFDDVLQELLVAAHAFGFLERDFIRAERLGQGAFRLPGERRRVREQDDLVLPQRAGNQLVGRGLCFCRGRGFDRGLCYARRILSGVRRSGFRAGRRLRRHHRGIRDGYGRSAGLCASIDVFRLNRNRILRRLGRGAAFEQKDRREHRDRNDDKACRGDDGDHDDAAFPLLLRRGRGRG